MDINCLSVMNELHKIGLTQEEIEKAEKLKAQSQALFDAQIDIVLHLQYTRILCFQKKPIPDPI